MKIRNNFKLLYVVIVLSLIPPIFVVNPPLDYSLSSITLYFSAIAGYAGIMLLLWFFVLGTRSVVSLFTDDFAQVMKIHSWIGKYGTLLIFMHPILATISYGQSLAFILWPSFMTKFDDAMTLGRTAIWILLVIWISSALLREKMSQRPWKYLHFGAYIAAPFALLHIPISGSSYTTQLGARFYFFIIVIGFAVFVLLRLRGALNINKSSYVITRQQEISPEVFAMQLAPNDEYPISPQPGQYVYIKHSWFSEDHPFSVLNFDTDSYKLTLGYKVYGMFTRQLSHLSPGKKVYISGPFGHFTQDIDKNPVVYIAGGIGVTPFVWRAMHESDEREQWMFYANRTPESAAFQNTLRQTLKGHFVPVYSRVSKTDPGYETGHIRGKLLTKYLDNPKRFSYYLCGPNGMIKAITSDLTKLGVSPNNIYREEFNF